MAQVVGRPTPRVEGEEKVTGEALYSADVALPETLWGKMRIKSLPLTAEKVFAVTKS